MERADVPRALPRRRPPPEPGPRQSTLPAAPVGSLGRFHPYVGTRHRERVPQRPVAPPRCAAPEQEDGDPRLPPVRHHPDAQLLAAPSARRLRDVRRHVDQRHLDSLRPDRMRRDLLPHDLLHHGSDRHRDSHHRDDCRHPRDRDQTGADLRHDRPKLGRCQIARLHHLVDQQSHENHLRRLNPLHD